VRAFLLVAALILAASAALAQRASDKDLAAIRAVIEAQIEAFKRDDGEAAFRLASPRIKTIFKDPDTFMRMVRADYQAVYRPRLVSFRDLEIIEGNLVQPVLVIGPSGVPQMALYIMERQPDGAWSIGGCVIVAEPDKGT
jgi:hypothetical protein